MALLRETLPTRDMEYYVCGPGPIMSAVVDDLRANGVSAGNVHTKSFGPGEPCRQERRTERPAAGRRTATAAPCLTKLLSGEVA